MTDSYSVLGVTPESDEKTIRKQYLALVRQFPPDRAPERFKEIRAAYDRLCNPIERWSDELFAPDVDDSMERVARDVRRELCGKRIPLDVLMSLGDG